MPHEHQVAQGVEVAERLGHLLAFDQQEARVHPEVRELLAGERLRLRDFVFVVRKDEVFAAEMDVEALAQVLHAHGGALDVPAGTAGTDLGVPALLAGFGSLPQGEVAGIVFVVFVDVDARAVGHAGEVLLAELAVRREAGDAEVVRAFVGAIGVAGADQSGDEVRHLR